MPAIQKILRTRDLLREQDRITISLACHHVVSVTAVQVAMMRPVEVIEGIFRAETYLCPFCPDPPPQNVNEQKSIRQLWREAGEP